VIGGDPARAAGRLAGKRAIVTGAGSGIGRASARLFAAEGAAVLVVDRSAEAIEQTAALIRADGGVAIAQVAACFAAGLFAGGGAIAITHLVTTPGSTAVVLDAQVPSARAAVDELLGGPQDSYCSPKVARRLAAVAWERAIRLDGAAATPDRAVGLAVTASLKTSRPKRGGHRICAAVQTLDGTFSAELVLTKDARSRADEELVAAALALDLLTKAVGLPAECHSDLATLLRGGERIAHDEIATPAPWRDLLTPRQGPAPPSPRRLLVMRAEQQPDDDIGVGQREIDRHLPEELPQIFGIGGEPHERRQAGRADGIALGHSLGGDRKSVV
jgi:NAD(P)-dependent dehydrogenase (short-subunit alcohol dehydrogenase family)